FREERNNRDTCALSGTGATPTTTSYLWSVETTADHRRGSSGSAMLFPTEIGEQTWTWSGRVEGFGVLSFGSLTSHLMNSDPWFNTTGSAIEAVTHGSYEVRHGGTNYREIVNYEIPNDPDKNTSFALMNPPLADAANNAGEASTPIEDPHDDVCFKLL